MTINGKRDGFTLEDFEAVAAVASMRRGRAKAIAGEVREAVADWPSFATAAGVPEAVAAAVRAGHRLDVTS